MSDEQAGLRIIEGGLRIIPKDLRIVVDRDESGNIDVYLNDPLLASVIQLVIINREDPNPEVSFEYEFKSKYGLKYGTACLDWGGTCLVEDEHPHIAALFDAEEAWSKETMDEDEEE